MIMTGNLNGLIRVFLFIPLHYIVYLFFYVRTHKPLKNLLFTELAIADIILFYGSVWVTFIATPGIDVYAAKLDKTTISHYFEYVHKIHDTDVNEAYTLCIIALWTKFFFALKVNSTLGPFIKIFKMNAKQLLIWLILFIIVLLSATNLLLIISSEKPYLTESCSEYYECFKILLEGSVGEVNFNGFDSWEAYLLYMSFIIIFMVLLFSMLIAMMTNTFNTVAEQGDLHYFKEIFDLRYSYKVDRKYGILGSL